MISYLDELAWCVPTRKAWDELIFLPPPAEPHAPNQSRHLGYNMGCTMDLGSALTPLWFRVSGLNGEFICIVQGLLFEGSVLIYDPTTNRAELVPMWEIASDLFPVEEASARVLSNIVIQDPLEDAPRMDCFGECREEHSAEAPMIPSTWVLLSVRRSQWNRNPSLTSERRAAKAQESDSSESTPCHYSLRHCCCPDSISWADEDQEEGKEQEETEGEEQLTPPASPQGEPVEELPILEQESLGRVPCQGDMPGDSKGEEVVVHAAKEEIDHLS